MKIGFIGLGIMGQPMALNLLKAGHTLTVFDINPERMNPLAQSGAAAASSAREASAGMDVIITMLPNSPDVRRAVTERDGVLAGAGFGAVLIDMSSIAPGVTREIEAECRAYDVHMLDAPVSGGEPKAIDGTLAIMAGGDEAVFQSVRESILLKVGSSAVYCGAIGAGNTVKLANQVIVACNIAACAEALTLAKSAGVDPQTVLNAVRNGLAGSAAMNAKVPMMIERNYKPGFKLDLHIKDLANALDTGNSLDIPLPLSNSIIKMMRSLSEDGHGGEDHSVLAAYYAKISGTDICG